MFEGLSMPFGDVGWMLIVMGVLNALSNLLEWIANLTPNDTDNKIAKWFKKIVMALEKFIDFFIARGKKR